MCGLKIYGELSERNPASSRNSTRNPQRSGVMTHLKPVNRKAAQSSAPRQDVVALQRRGGGAAPAPQLPAFPIGCSSCFRRAGKQPDRGTAGLLSTRSSAILFDCQSAVTGRRSARPIESRADWTASAPPPEGLAEDRSVFP